MALPRRFAGKVAVVTASTQGIGFGIARRLGLEGASVVVSSRKQKNVDETVVALKSEGIDVIGVVCHVSNEKQRSNLIQQTVQKFGHIDVLVSNAAANPSTEAILNMPESILDKLWEVNVKASVLLLQAAQPYLSKGSSVVLVSSFTAFHPPPTMSMYGVTKAALLALAKNWLQILELIVWLLGSCLHILLLLSLKMKLLGKRLKENVRSAGWGQRRTWRQQLHFLHQMTLHT